MKCKVNCSVDSYLAEAAKCQGINMSLLLNNSLKAYMDNSTEIPIETQLEKAIIEESKAIALLATIKGKRVHIQQIFEEQNNKQSKEELELAKMEYRTRVAHLNRGAY